MGESIAEHGRDSTAATTVFLADMMETIETLKRKEQPLACA